MPVLKVEAMGDQLVVLFPQSLADKHALKEGDEVHITPRPRPAAAVRITPEERAAIEETAGMLAKYDLTLDEWNDLTNEGEEL